MIQNVDRDVTLYMKHKIIMHKVGFLIFVFAILNSSSGNVQARDVVESKAEFIQKVAGKKITDAKLNTWMIAQPNGQIRGKFKGINIKGRWDWNGKYWCRSARIGLLSLPNECQQIALNGKTLILKRKKGNGTTHSYQLN